MVIQPKIRGFICTTAHPAGCAKHVDLQIEYIRKKQALPNGPARVLVVGASAGYGLASRISAAFGSKAATLGIFFERPAREGRTASAGWYNTAAFDRAAKAAGLYSKNLNGDAFSDAVKSQALQAVRSDLKQIDLLVYSLAAPARVHPKSGQKFNSTLKPIGAAYTNKTVNADTGEVGLVTIAPAQQEDIDATVAVMGGEDWELWVDTLSNAKLLAPGFKTVAFSYIGPEVTMPIYRNGTIGAAKSHLENTAKKLDEKLKSLKGRALVSIQKALVTQASSAIPVVPLYIALLYKVMKEKNIHEGCVEQIDRLFRERLYGPTVVPLDAEGRVRLDDWELRPDVQAEVDRRWREVSTQNLGDLSDIRGYRDEFLRLFGFGLPGVDYSADLDPDVPLELLS